MTALLAAYTAAQYRIDLDAGTALILRVQQHDPRHDSLLRAAGCQHHWHLLSACNPGSQRLEAQENAARTAALRAALAQRQWEYCPAVSEAADGDWREPGYCVFDADPEALLALTRHYGQAAILAGRLGEAPQLVWLQSA